MHSLLNLFKNGFSNNWWFTYICVKWWCDALILTYHTMLNAICAAVHIKCILASKVQPKGECSVISMKNQESQRYLFHGRIKVWFLHYNFFFCWSKGVFMCVFVFERTWKFCIQMIVKGDLNHFSVGFTYDIHILIMLLC